ncbi:MAG: BON domain-containing protein [Acidimicrobiia bacterium]
MQAFLRRFVPISGSAVALWTWHNRDEVLEWAGFGVRAAQKLVAGDTTDVKTEARLRASLNGDRRTRHAPGLRIEVQDGVVQLRGVVDEDVREVAVAIAKRTTGVERVDDDDLHEVRRRRTSD